ncbi:hypothetical protein OFN62_35470, partial [Escherichia coli]|nr:hypothetical protein [Escherichia coli]
MSRTARMLNVVLLVAAVLTGGRFYAEHHHRKPVLYGDAMGYYLYLPSTFIYHNHRSIAELPA